MLVLSRKEAQRIRVGDSIVVSIVKIAGDKVRVGIEAPSDVLVLRDELEAWDEAPKGAAGSPAKKPATTAPSAVESVVGQAAHGELVSVELEIDPAALKQSA